MSIFSSNTTNVVKFGQNAVQIRDDSGLSDGALLAHVPAVFAIEPWSNVSAKYTQIKTSDVLKALRNEGFLPVFAAQGGSKVAGKGEYTKHVIRFRHASSTTVDAKGRKRANEVALYNSHDRTSSYRMLGGAFEFLCTNGLLFGDIFNEIKVKHTGKNVVEDVVRGCLQTVQAFPLLNEHIAEAQATMLTARQARDFAHGAIAMRFENSIATLGFAPVTADEVLRPNRAADRANDLWATFNLVQENLIQTGGLHYRTRDARNRPRNGTVRAVRSVDDNRKLNVAMAAYMAEVGRHVRSA